MEYTVNATDRTLSQNRSSFLQLYEQECTGGVRNKSTSTLTSGQTITVPPGCRCPNETQESCPCIDDPLSPFPVCGNKTTCQTQVDAQRNKLVNAALEAEDYRTFYTQINQPHNDVHNQCNCVMATGMDGMLILTSRAAACSNRG